MIVRWAAVAAAALVFVLVGLPRSNVGRWSGLAYSRHNRTSHNRTSPDEPASPAHDGATSNSLIGWLSEMCNSTGRCAALNASKRFSFVHISKCAGSSWIRTLSKGVHMLPRGHFFPTEEAGVEYTVRHQNRVYPDADYHLISLKSPRHHVWSLFAECKYDPFFVGKTRNAGFPRSGATPANDAADFGAWLGHFSSSGGGVVVDDFECYHPSNFQSRYLATDLKGGIAPHGVRGLPPSARFEPSAAAAVATYWEQDWAALTEFYHESQCLLFHRLDLGGGGGASNGTRSYVNVKCRCPKPEGGEVHVTHHPHGHRSTLRDLPPDSLARIENLTRVDTRVYNNALAQFMREIAWLESDLALGRRVLCDPVLRRLEPELLYLGVNVTDLYNKAGESEAKDYHLQ